MYSRILENTINQQITKPEVLIIYGARQTGKTTLLTKLFTNNKDAVILNCERPEVYRVLNSEDIYQYKMLFENNKIVILDEAQTIENIGSKLKLIYDSPEFNCKIIATGSSSFELSNKVTEPLTGRNIKYNIFPLSYSEIIEQKSWLWMQEHISDFLIFGTYPGIIDLPPEEKKLKLSNLASDYLFKDILMLENLRNPGALKRILESLAYQIGSQVSYNEIAQNTGTNVRTVERYIDLLKKTFVIFELSSFSRNLRNEIKKSKKFYFYDNGIRNAIINNYAALSTRQDAGALWENYCISERLKHNGYTNPLINQYFWRTYDGAEIDLIEEADGKINAFEFKLKPGKRASLPNSFSTSYPVETFNVVTTQNLHDYLFISTE
jgi:predicted AAA+ superfamily ATPase